jgi:hypothetical protein
MFACKAGASVVEHLLSTILYFRLLALPAFIRLGWKGLPGVYTLAYWEHSYITAVKKFYNIDTWAQCYKTFLSAIYECLYLAGVFVPCKLFKPSLKTL